MYSVKKMNKPKEEKFERKVHPLEHAGHEMDEKYHEYIHEHKSNDGSKMPSTVRKIMRVF